jgi:hypothetical protein
MDKKAKWTFMVYMAGDNSLSDAGDTDLREMRTVGSTADVNVVAEFDNEGDRGTNRYYIKRDGSSEPVESLGETDSGDPKTLVDFVAWAREKYPAERYGLVLWNHGGGWEPSEMDRVARSVGSRDYSVREASERSATPLKKLFFRTSLKKILSRPSPKDRAICSDDGSGHSLDTVELGNVLDQAKKILQQSLDLLGMDACLMSNLEVAYQAQGYAQYIVASEESEPNNGWPYDRVLRKLIDAPQLPMCDLATHIVEAYIKSYADVQYSGAVTQSAFDLSKMATLTGPLDRLAGALIDNMPKASREIWDAQRKSVRFWHNTLWDILDFCQKLEKASANQDIRKAAQEVLSALKPGPGKFIMAESHRGKEVERVGGVSIYLLSPLTDISEYYADLTFAKDHRWLEMLKTYHGA